MYSDGWLAALDAVKKKTDFIKRKPVGYLIASILAGIYVGFGVLLAFTIGGMLDGEPYAKIVMGATFSVALSLIVMAGAELFTGNNMNMAIGVLSKTVKVRTALKLFVFCYFGNWIGAVLLSLVYHGTGLGEIMLSHSALSGNAVLLGEFFASSAQAKMSIPFLQLLLRGILCNVFVCLAVWCGYRMKSEVAKLIMIFWCLLAFVVIGFEHSIANMTLLTVAMLAPFNSAVSIGGYFYNISVATLGNIIGGAIGVALPYYLITREGNS